MAKAMLIMDMPNNCISCNLCLVGKDKHTKEFYWRCMIHPTKMITKDEGKNGKPTWCPLREVPQKKEIEFRDSDITRIEKIGYNACIDEILRGGRQ